MATKDTVPGTWTLWARTPVVPTTTQYTATFTGGQFSGDVTITSDTGGSYTGTWTSKDQPEDEKVSFEIEGIFESGKKATFSGFLVGLAVGGPISHGLMQMEPFGAWAAYKTSD